MKAILFDFDGVLADTMEDTYDAWSKAFNKYGIKIEKEEYFLLEGKKLIKIAEDLGKRYGLNNLDFKKIVNLKNEYYEKNYNFKPYEGIMEIIINLKTKGYKIGIVTASPKIKLEKTVPKKFLKNFNVIICGDDVINGKPHPESYLNAAEKLNLDPKDCIVFENAPLGIKAAKSAGMYCIAITTTLNINLLKEADAIINEHKDFIHKIENIERHN